MAKRDGRVLQSGKVVWGKHPNDYPNGRDKGSWVGGNPRYSRSKPTKSMHGNGRGNKPVVD
ncbi:MAG: hypothetical protein ACREGR_00385 [Minisyncoccia bacterium]